MSWKTMMTISLRSTCSTTNNPTLFFPLPLKWRSVRFLVPRPQQEVESIEQTGNYCECCGKPVTQIRATLASRKPNVFGERRHHHHNLMPDGRILAAIRRIEYCRHCGTHLGVDRQHGYRCTQCGHIHTLPRIRLFKDG